MNGLMSFSMERDDLCERLGGGLPRGSLVVIEGPHGAGKSILAQRFMHGLVQNGTGVVYVSTELTTSGFLRQMSSLRYDVKDALMDEQLVFVPIHTMLAARAPRHELLERMAKAKRLYSRDVIMFDAFSKFLDDHLRFVGDHPESMEQVEGVLHLFKRLTGLGKTIVLTLERGQVPAEVASGFKECADVLLRLQTEVVGTNNTRRIIVERWSRAGDRFGEVLGYRVEPGLGIVLEIRTVV